MRARGNSSDRGSRFNTYISGVTFQTSPSGSTIVKSGVTATVVSATNLNATTITGTNLVNAAETGYVLPYSTATGKGMVTGVIAIPTAGVTKVEASYFGFTAVNFCIAQVGTTNVSNTTQAAIVVTTSKGSLFPTAGVSRVYFRAYQAGVAMTKVASAQYFAIGA